MYFSAQSCPQKWQRLVRSKITNWTDSEEQAWQRASWICCALAAWDAWDAWLGADWPPVNVYIAIIAIENHHFWSGACFHNINWSNIICAFGPGTRRWRNSQCGAIYTWADFGYFLSVRLFQIPLSAPSIKVSPKSESGATYFHISVNHL